MGGAVTDNPHVRACPRCGEPAKAIYRIGFATNLTAISCPFCGEFATDEPWPYSLTYTTTGVRTFVECQCPTCVAARAHVDRVISE